MDCPVYTDYRQMLKENKPDFVAIATESGKHAAIALDCIKAGANVLIEKPIALSVADAQAILDAATILRGYTFTVPSRVPEAPLANRIIAVPKSSP